MHNFSINKNIHLTWLKSYPPFLWKIFKSLTLRAVERFRIGNKGNEGICFEDVKSWHQDWNRWLIFSPFGPLKILKWKYRLSIKYYFMDAIQKKHTKDIKSVLTWTWTNYNSAWLKLYNYQNTSPFKAHNIIKICRAVMCLHCQHTKHTHTLIHHAISMLLSLPQNLVLWLTRIVKC